MSARNIALAAMAFYLLKADAVPEARIAKDKGTIPEKLLASFDDRTVLAVYPLDEKPKKEKLVFVTSEGQVKVSEAEEYYIRRNKFDALSLREGDTLLYVGVKKYGWHIAFETDTGKERIFRTSVDPTARKTKGVRAFKGHFVKAYQTEK